MIAWLSLFILISISYLFGCDESASSALHPHSSIQWCSRSPEATPTYKIIFYAEDSIVFSMACSFSCSRITCTLIFHIIPCMDCLDYLPSWYEHQQKLLSFCREMSAPSPRDVPSWPSYKVYSNHHIELNSIYFHFCIKNTEADIQK